MNLLLFYQLSFEGFDPQVLTHLLRIPPLPCRVHLCQTSPASVGARSVVELFCLRDAYMSLIRQCPVQTPQCTV